MDAAATRLAAGTATACQIFQEDMPGQVGSLTNIQMQDASTACDLIMLQSLPAMYGPDVMVQRISDLQYE